MRIARFMAGNDPKYALVTGNSGDEELIVLHGDPLFGKVEATGERYSLQDNKLLTPIIPRSKVVGVARNYRAHANETGAQVPTSPLLFFKPNTAVVGPDDPIIMPPWSQQIDHEAELAVVISRVCRNVAIADADKYIYGYTCANDVTARDIQASESQWARAKGFDSSCPLGPWIETDFDWQDAAITCRVDGETRQAGTTADMIFSVPFLVSFISHSFTLLPGDVILTGTPAGIGPLQAGQRVEVEITGLGVLRNVALRP